MKPDDFNEEMLLPSNFLVGMSGVFPCTAPQSLTVTWRGFSSTVIAASQRTLDVEEDKVCLEQIILSPSLQNDGGVVCASNIRLALCGSAWLDSEHYGFGNNPLFSLGKLQNFIDSHQTPPFTKLDGDFAIAYVPPDRSCCFIYRSVTCTKSIYYRFFGKYFLWSTNPINLFFEGKPSVNSIDLELLPALTIAGEIPPARTVYREVKRIPSGGCLQIKYDSSIQMSTDDFVVHDDYRNLSLLEASSQLRSLVETAVCRKLPQGSRIGVLLSGGIDSAIIASEAKNLTEDVVGIHWNWKTLDILSGEQKAAESISRKLNIELLVRDFSTSISEHGDYLKSMENLAVPFNHSFFHCFTDSATAAAERGISVMVSGHLGDAALLGHWSDPIFAGLNPVWNPLSLIKTFGFMLTQESRIQATQNLFRFLHLSLGEAESGARHRIALCSSWLTPVSVEKAQELGCHIYRRDLPTLSSKSVYHAIKQGINGDAELDTATVFHAFLPKGVVLIHPYADRKLLEFCLSLKPQHRNRFYAGSVIRKVALRLAYLDILPQEIVGRVSRVPYAAVAESFCRNNHLQLSQLLGKESMLEKLEVIDSRSVSEI